MSFLTNTIAKLPESGVLCGNNTELGEAEDHLSLEGEGDLFHLKQSVIVIQYTISSLFCFYILLFNG